MSETDKLYNKVKNLVESGMGRTRIARELGISDSKATRIIRRIKVGIEYLPKTEEFVPITKSKTKFTKREIPQTGSILVIGDAHAKHGESNERFTKLGKVINEYQPDVIVNIGDMADMESLSSYDVGKKSFEGRRLVKDYEALWDALERIEKEVKGNYSPIKIALMGNHEERINKAINSDPKLEGTISIDDLKFNEYGWQVFPFLVPAEVMGITFQHYFVTGSMDRAISAENTGRTIIKKYHRSALAGHSHKLDLAWDAGPSGLMVAGTVGCYFSHIEKWQSLQSQKQFWRGLVFLDGVKDGTIEDCRLLSMEKINRIY